MVASVWSDRHPWTRENDRGKYEEDVEKSQGKICEEDLEDSRKKSREGNDVKRILGGTATTGADGLGPVGLTLSSV